MFYKSIYKLYCQSPQSWSTLCDPMACSPQGSSVHGNSPGKNMKWVAMPSCRGFSQPRDRTQVSHIEGWFFTNWATREAQEYWSWSPVPSPGDLPNPGIKPGSPALQVDSLPTELLETSYKWYYFSLKRWIQFPEVPLYPGRFLTSTVL